MKRFSIILLSLLLSQVTVAQLIIKSIVHPETIQKEQSLYKKNTAPATLPFWDDFSITQNSADSIRIWGNDTTYQWNYEQSKNVFINATLAINPPSYKVATFDGLDANGGFHLDNELGLADQLQSDTIDLSTFNESDQIFISFYWQPGGNVEMPDEGDSLRLQFYNPNTTDVDPWKTIWMMEGDEQLADSIFTQEAFKITQEFLTEKFVFRFQSFGDLDGPFDAWHLDWIYINANRENDDLFYLDRGFNGQLTSPFSPFTSMPISQFKINQNNYIGTPSTTLFNLDQFLQPTEYIFVVRSLNDNTRIDSLQYGNEMELRPNPDPLKLTTKRNQSFAGIDFSTIPNLDSLVVQSELYIQLSDDDFLDGSNINLRINDTLRAEYLLHNYYAYDDGTAEYAAGTNVLGGQIAVKFWLEEEDTLTHVAIHFPNISPSAEGKALTLNIFKELSKNNLPYRSQQINVKSDSIINGFTYYKLARPLVVSDTFYISYQQNSSDYIGVGFDRSNMEASGYIYENNGDGWKQNIRIKGSLMIRAIFEGVEDFSLGSIHQKKYQVYPNPTSGNLSIEGNYQSIEVMDISGRVYLQERAKSIHDLSKLEVGLYLLKVHQIDGERTYKIIKK